MSAATRRQKAVSSRTKRSSRCVNLGLQADLRLRRCTEDKDKLYHVRVKIVLGLAFFCCLATGCGA